MTKTTTKTGTSPAGDIDKLVSSLNTLRKERKTWEEGAFKSSNEQLYRLLEKCHRFLERLRDDLKLRRKLESALDRLEIEVRSNTSLELKLAKAVFGQENRRIHAYVRVLQVAKTDLSKGASFSDWILERGGVEEIRRKPKAGPTPAEQAKIDRALAEEILADADPISARFRPDNSLQPAEGGDYEFSVGLVRVDSDGKAAVVFGSSKVSLVRAVLAEAGSRLRDSEAVERSVSKHSKKQKERDDVLQKADLPADDVTWDFLDDLSPGANLALDAA